MAKPDWGDLQKRFLSEHTKIDISPRGWCEAQGLDYSSAKRYIKVTNYGTNSQKGSVKKVTSSQKAKEPKKATKAEPELETTPAIVKHSYAAKTPDDFGIPDRQMIFAQRAIEGEPRVEAYRLAGYSDVGHGAYANACSLYTSPSPRDS